MNNWSTMIKYPEISLEIAQEMIKEYDNDNDGRLSYEEFAKLIMETPDD